MKLVIITFLIIVSTASYADKNTHGSTLSAWVFNIYNSPITRNKFSSLFDFSDNSIYKIIKVVSSTDAGELYKECLETRYDIIVVPDNIARVVQKKCKYISLLYSVKQPAIYVLKGSENRIINNIKTIGVIVNSPASEFLRTENPEYDMKWEVKYFNNGANLIYSLLDGNVDGIVTIKSQIKSVSSVLFNKVQSVYELKNKRKLHALIPVDLDKGKQSFIIENLIRPSSSNLFGDFKRN